MYVWVRLDCVWRHIKHYRRQLRHPAGADRFDWRRLQNNSGVATSLHDLISFKWTLGRGSLHAPTKTQTIQTYARIVLRHATKRACTITLLRYGIALEWHKFTKFNIDYTQQPLHLDAHLFIWMITVGWRHRRLNIKQLSNWIVSNWRGCRGQDSG